MSRNHSASGTQQRRWQRVRRQVLDAAGWHCAVCGKYANQVDHILPLHRGGERFDKSNLQPICRRDHILKTKKENRVYPQPAGAGAWRAFVEELA